MGKILEQSFFNKSTPLVAQNLIGKFLVRKINGEEIALQIFETEAYDGSKDKASHASRGRTARTEVMFGPSGYFYVYLCYGMHHMLNVVTGPKGYPAAVLIRSAIPACLTSDAKQVNGPGKLTRALDIDKTFNALCASPESNLWFEDRGVLVDKKEIKKTKRVGIEYAGPTWSKKLFRFLIEK